jgi:hypothetical protein
MWDLDLMIGQRPARKANGRFVKGQTAWNKGKKWNEWMDGRKQRKVRNRLKHTGNPKLPGWNKKAIAAVKDNKVVFFDSSVDAERKTGICGRNIRSVCEKKRNFAGGCRWFFADDKELLVYLNA